MLDELHEELPQFWSAVDAAHAALDGLADGTISTLNASAGDVWIVRVRRALDDVTKWCYSSGDWLAQRGDVRRAVSMFLRAVNSAKESGKLFDPAPGNVIFSQFDDDLRALRRSKGTGSVPLNRPEDLPAFRDGERWCDKHYAETISISCRQLHRAWGGNGLFGLKLSERRKAEHGLYVYLRAELKELSSAIDEAKEAREAGA